MPLALAILFLFARTYPVDGIVVAVDPVARTMLVAHRAIPKYMPAMTMPFRAEDAAQLKALHPGMRIRFELSVSKSTSLARNIQAAGGPDAVIPPPRETLQTGDLVPDAVLLDETGRSLHLKDLRGKVLAIDFIYTRCPLPDVCPRLSANFAVIQKHLRHRADLLLLSITVDPDYDTPPVLAEYARRWTADPGRWRFLTGDVAPVAARLGEVYWTDEGSIGHNSSTVVISRDGRIAARLEGSQWRPGQLESLLEHELEKTK